MKKTLLDITYQTASKYHIAFGQEKSKLLVIGQKNEHNNNLLLGEMEIERTEKYKYLGMTLNKKDNISDHLKDIKAKTEGAYQTIISLLHNKEYNKIEITTIWEHGS